MTPNKLKRFRRIYSSVFTKLILISLATWFFILIAVVFTFQHSRDEQKGSFLRNTRLYIQYIIDDLGSPPDIQRAVTLHGKTGMHISFTDEHTRWTTMASFPRVDNLRFRPLHGSDSLQIGGRFGHHVLRLQNGDSALYFEFAGIEDDDQRHKMAHIFLIFVLSFIIFGTYLAIKRVLRPLGWLSTGVAEVTAGNLSHQMPVRGNDELTDLAASFNKMTAQIKSMMEAREHLLRDVSHELRSPLARMKVALEFISDNEIKAEVKREVAEMESMIESILESARDHHEARKQNLTRFDLDQFLHEITDTFAKRAPGTKYSSPGQQVYCYADRGSLKTVFRNLIENGIKFSEEGGRPVEVQLNRHNRNTHVTVADYGTGIDAADLPYIFEPFYRVDKSRSRKTGGFGLGLSLCKAIVEAHGGKIEVHSDTGQGTMFSIILPVVR